MEIDLHKPRDAEQIQLASLNKGLMMDHKNNILEEMDNAKFGKSQIKTILVAGAGFLTDSYDNFVIGLMVPMMAYAVNSQTNPTASPSSNFPGFWDAALIKSAAAFGNVVGQLLFGFLGDILGRKKIYGLELIILIIGAIGTSLVGVPAYGLSFTSIIIFWRFILGVGVGGDYPVSSVLTSEFAAAKYRGAMMALVFSMQGIGVVLGTAVSLVCLFAYKDLINENVAALDSVWRILAAFGVIPALLAVYFRLTIAESVRFTIDVQKNVEKAQLDSKAFLNNQKIEITDTSIKPSFKPRFYWINFKEYFGQWKNFKVLLGTSLTWFFLDIGFYGTNLNTPIVLNAVGFTDKSTPFNAMWTASMGQLVINLCGFVPGYFLCIALIDRVGRKPLQLIGFLVLTICFGIMASTFSKENVIAQSQNNTGTPISPLSISIPVFITIYCIAQFTFNAGPNTTTFIIPGEVFPTRVRSAGHGISAALGKIGALMSALLFQMVSDYPDFPDLTGRIENINMGLCLWIFTFCMTAGFFLTFLLPETKGKTLEEIDTTMNNESERKIEFRFIICK
jgi:PHS family inorganic phosphate transporter-like MFS transporter